ncbi:MAG TPA: outer membrane protein assembly factor BamA [Urbifossiella sp.]|nr:outer membrane protein assembly factor BamA [Urbifossiella sp.]
MTACRIRRRTALAAVAAVAALAWGHGAPAQDGGPVGRVVAEVIPVSATRMHPPEQILGVMHTRPGRPYDETVANEDVRRLVATKWFVPGGVRLHTAAAPNNQVTVYVHLTELTGTVQEISFDGAEHLSRDKLRTLTGVRKGDPMNPMANDLGRAAILREYRDAGRAFATVELVEGGKATDTRVAYRIVEGPIVRVSGVEFRGNEAGMSGRLKTVLATKTAFAGFMGGKFNPVSLDADLKKLTEYYHGLGYLAVQIEPEVIPAPDMATVRIVYHVRENTQFQVSGHDISGNKTFPAEQLAVATTIKDGNRYDRWVAQADAKRLENWYGMRGHRVAVEEVQHLIPDDPGKVQVTYQVHGDSGAPKRVGTINVRGNEITRENVILRQLEQVNVLPGQILQYPRLEEARMRLARLGIFDPQDPPQVNALPSELDSDFQDVEVRVRETKTGQFMVGGGVNSNAGFNASIMLNESNFDLFRFPTSWDDFRMGRAFRGAGQQFRIEAQPGTQFGRYSATFSEPYLFDTKFGLSNSIYYYNRAFLEYNEDRVGDRLSISRQLDPIWRASFTTRVEGVNVKDVAYYAPESITRDIGWHFLLGLRAGLTRDTRDSFLFPTTGSVLDLGFEQVLGDYTFPIGTAEYTKFISSEYLQREDGSGKHVLALRSQMQVTGSNAPVYERLYAGGFRSLRGFTFRGVGPTENGLHTGGTFSFLNTIEYQLPLLQNDKLFFVTFLDHGTVESDVSIRDYRVSAGFGFRVAVPALGPLPLAFDFAFPLNRAPGDNQQIFSFYVGLFGGS